MPGAVKTRMQPELAAEACADLASTMCRHICATLAQHWCGETVIKAAPDASHPLFADLSRRHGFAVEAQSGADLGERMWEALGRGMARSDRAAVVGADVPHIPPEIVREAQSLMAAGVNVIGPATDGGFYFLGLCEAASGLFRDVRWGGGEVLKAVLERAQSMGVRIHRLPELRDIDRYEDLQWLAGEYPDYRRLLGAAPRCEGPGGG